MKKLFYFIIMMIPFFLSCSDDMDDLDASKEAVFKNEHRISKDDALGIVNKYFKGTRSVGNISYDCVRTVNGTRSEVINNDTIAHIYNFGENDGFMVISSDNRISPVLAFSETGHFSYEENENDVVYVNFIKRLDARMQNINETDTAVSVPEDIFAGCVAVSPKVSTKISQRNPWDRFVLMEHPECPTGCVPTALVQVMIACKDSLKYKDITYHFRPIEKAIYDKVHEEELNPDNDHEIAFNIDRAYSIAVSYVSQLVAFIGKDLKTVYTPERSTTSVFAARKFLKKLDYDVLNETYIEFNLTDIAESIYNGNIAVTVGHDRNETSHMWLIDGAKYCWNDIKDHKLGINPDKTYLHCNWGWGGLNDGYYTGNIFRPNGFRISEMTYISVKKDLVVHGL